MLTCQRKQFNFWSKTRQRKALVHQFIDDDLEQVTRVHTQASRSMGSNNWRWCEMWIWILDTHKYVQYCAAKDCIRKLVQPIHVYLHANIWSSSTAWQWRELPPASVIHVLGSNWCYNHTWHLLKRYSVPTKQLISDWRSSRRRSWRVSRSPRRRCHRPTTAGTHPPSAAARTRRMC